MTVLQESRKCSVLRRQKLKYVYTLRKLLDMENELLLGLLLVSGFSFAER